MHGPDAVDRTRKLEDYPFQCGLCSKRYKACSILVWHARTHHNEAVEVHRRLPDDSICITPIIKRVLNCPHCPRQFSYKEYPTPHLLTAHGMDASPSSKNCV